MKTRIDLMKKRLIIAGAITLSGGILGFIAVLAHLLSSVSQPADSIGIIGGADNPTAIFLMSRLGFSSLLIILPFLILITAGISLLISALIFHLKQRKPEK